MAAVDESRYLALRDRAHALLLQGGAVGEEALLAHVYGGVTPPAIRTELAAPLVGDPRLERLSDGRWTLRGRGEAASMSSVATGSSELTALALATSGPNPRHGRIVQVAAIRLLDGQPAQRFTATVNPQVKVPRYVARQLGFEPEQLNELPALESLLDDLVDFLGGRAIVAQDVGLVWAFVEAEARRLGRVLAEPPLVDFNELASRVLSMTSKPSLGPVAARLGVAAVRIGDPQDDARLLALIVPRLFSHASAGPVDVLPATATRAARAPLQRPATARALPDQPGVYVLRDEHETALYVGKARRLRSRVSAYVHRPLGATRRLEGLVGSVDEVDPVVCPTDLDALILENREIARLRPQFNTARQQRAPRLWIRLPPPAPVGDSRRKPRRLEQSGGPSAAAGDFVGPFRTESAAESVRHLVRDVFDLDALRTSDPIAYERRLAAAWDFLHGHADLAERCARTKSLALLRRVLSFDLPALLFPADPHQARLAVVRPTPTGAEVFLVDRGIFAAHTDITAEVEATSLTSAVLDCPAAPRSTPDDRPVVVRWLGAQRPPARVVLLPEQSLAARDVLEDAVASAFTSRPGEPGATGGEDAVDPCGGASADCG